MGSENSGILARLERGFNPRNVATVGATQRNNYNWLRNHLAFQASHGRLYHVNIDRNEWPGAEALGVQNFPSLLDIPAPVDYVTVSVPRQFVPRVLEDCIRKGVAVVHVFTAGFGESGELAGIELEHQIVELAQKAGIAVIGPNCLGLFNPELGVGQISDLYHGDKGYLGYITQSGSQARGIATEAYIRGVKISKCISMGNGVVVDVPDLLDYLAQDKDTRVIGMFLEGVRSPARFFQSLQQACRHKPVLVWKVAQTEDAARAAAAHSGASYLRQDLWDALVLRCGAIPVESVEEMADTAMAVHTIPPSLGVRIGLFAISGGHSTEMANVFSKHGFRIPVLADQSYQELGSFLSLIGGNYVNPIQAAGEHFERIMDVLARDSNLDVVAAEVPVGRVHQNPAMLESRIKGFKGFQARSTRPVIAVLSPHFPRVASTVLEEVEKRFLGEHIPTLIGFDRAARALKHAIDYHSQRELLGE
ncbi:MAG: CoA-binding protein [Chloroflexi bacterium]|nr:CoA-binding protein [Chloroflexota bacterium]